MGMTTEQREALDTRAFRDLMGFFPTGVAVVTSWGGDGPAGMTVNSLASLSLDPMLVMVGFDLASRTLQAVQRSDRFGINLLCCEQEEISRRFATKLSEEEKFKGVDFDIRLGVPILSGAGAWIVCGLEAFHRGGDHVIAVGKVLGTGRDPGAPEPLVFHRGRYTKLGPSPTS
jgi:3-hydroxy-9,10-secoandrosta-1,3,5(10)-triene-9,17-dione monooxygenase reductase component